jgi:hypothetical protein
MFRRVLILASRLALVACSKDKGNKGNDGWIAPEPVASTPGTPPVDNATGQQGNPHAQGQPANPHAGVAPDNPHAGGAPANPHAGVAPANPHAGVAPADPHGGSVDELPPGLEPPDPNREIDPNKYLKGKIVASKKTASKVKSGAILYLSVRPVDPKTGQVSSALLAVERIDLTGSLPVPFNLTEANAMVRGTQFAGDVQVYARVDQDGEARTKQKGDIEGAVLTRIPADKLVLTLDTILD